MRVAVGLDAGAVERVPDLADRLELDDLRDSGWAITGPAREDDGRTWVRAAKEFETPEDARRVMAEVSGPTGPFQDFRIRRDRSFLRTTTTFTGLVDLAAGLEAFGDDDLRQRLGGTSVGATAAELEQQLGQTLDRVFRIRVTARLPGEIEANAPTVADNGAVWTPSLGEQVTLRATSRAWNTRQVGMAGVSVAALLALGMVLVRRRLGRSLS